ncbi:MAG: cation-translocating P-type ATPase [Pseudomonadota bacterium]|nr:cation-translocating P-type ATPase [Pseudomonadota bacterium]
MSTTTLTHRSASAFLATPDASAFDEPEQIARFTRWAVDQGERSIGVSSLRLSGVTCAACALPIEEALRSVDGVIEATVNAAAMRASVRWDPTRTRPSALVDAVRKAGFDALPDTAAGARDLRRGEARQALWRLFVAAFCATQVMMLATPAYVAGAGGIEPDLLRLLNWGSWVMALPVMAFSAMPFFRGAWNAIRSHHIGMDVPVSIGIIVSFIASTGAAFDPHGPFGSAVYFDSLTMFVALLLAGRMLEVRARHRAAEALEDALGALPETALRVLADGRTECVGIARLCVGDRVRVAVGEAFPADGCVLEGCTSADEALLSGESSPQRKAPGAEVVAGSVNLEAPVVVQVLRTGADTRHEAIVALMREAQSQRPSSARWADRWAAPFLWAVLLLAGGAAAVWSVIDPSRAVWVAVSVLIVTCPCALSLATPSALLAAANSLARRGVLLRRLDALEVMAGCTRLFVDKTGTLTEDRPRYTACERLPAAALIDESALLQCAASLAAWSRHPLARALCESQPAATPAATHWHALREQPGAGVEGQDAQGRRWRLGSARWVGGIDAGTPDATEDSAGLETWFGPVGQPMARLHFEEALRPDVSAALVALRAEGLRVTLLSGDASYRVERMATALGLDSAMGGATPEAKLAAVRAAQAAGETVAMLGDGINDAPVLAQADVSLAMGAGALLARGQADAVLLADRIGDVVELRRMSRRCVRVIRQNIAWAATYNAVCVPLALVGLLPPWAAGIGMAASSLFVVGNALRLRR